MAKKIKQEYGIKYPFTTDGNTGSIVDINTTIKSKVRSILMHIIFTPKGQKLRDPNFGTDLIRTIFEANVSETWESIRTEIMNAVKVYLPEVTINDIQILKNDENIYQAYVKIAYSVKSNLASFSDNLIVEV